MEVHHHPHVPHKRKHLKEYLLEGLMIFVAVTLGFFAESLREHINEQSRAREYVSALQTELRADTTEYGKRLLLVAELRPQLDSLFDNIHEAPRFNYVIKGKWNVPVNEFRIPYFPQLGVIHQLESAGNLRLVGPKNVLLDIIAYESFVKGQYQHVVDGLEVAAEKLYTMEDTYCDESDFNAKADSNIVRLQKDAGAKTLEYNMEIVVRDRPTLTRMFNSVANYADRNRGYIAVLDKAKTLATALLNDLQKDE